MPDDLHPGEQDLEVGGDDLLDRDEPLAVRELDEPREQRRHLHAGEAPLAARGIPDERGEVQRERGDVGERVRRVDRERGEHREHALTEERLQMSSILLVELLPVDDPEPLLLERRAEIVRPQRVRASAELDHALADAGQLLVGCEPLRGGGTDAGVALLLQTGDADLEELVEVRTRRSRGT